MPHPGQTPHDPYRPGRPPPPARPIDEIRAWHESNESGFLDSSPLILELNASFARQRRRQMRYLVVFSVFVFTFTIFAWVYVRDSDPPWDADLPSSGPEPATRDCPAPDRLRQALDAATPSDSADATMRSPAQWDTPTLSRTVGANTETFARLKELLNDEEWQPRHPAWKSVDLGSHDRWQALGSAPEAAAAYYSRRGQDEAAMLAGMELALLAQKLQSISAWPAYYARGVEVHERACKAIASALRQSGMDSRTLSNVQAEFEGLTPSDVVLKERIDDFYAFERHLILGPRPGDAWSQPAAKLGSRLFFKPNQTLSLFTSSMRELADQTAKAPTVVTNQITLRLGPPGTPSGFPGGPNRAGMTYANGRVWYYSSLLDHLVAQRARHSLVLTMFGVRRYVLDHGRAPAKLEDLLPRYFVALPLDPWTGEPLHYNAKKGLIYSVGTNFKDEGGRDNDDPLSDNTEPTVMVRSSGP